MNEAVVELYPRANRFTLEAFDAMELREGFWRVKDLWPQSGVCFVAGPSMSGKSFWTLDAMVRIRRGEPVMGHRSVPCGVVYIASEGASGVRKRMVGLRREFGPIGPGFDMIGQAPNLTDAVDVETLAAALRDAKAAQGAAGIELGVVVIDTLSASIPGADENNAKDMSPVLTALQNLAVELGVLVLIVAHTGKDEERGLRGWSGLIANADGLVMLKTPAEDGLRSGSVVKVKDGEAGQRFGFTLCVVELGHDSDGDKITTCVVEHTDAPETPKKGRRANVAAQDAETIKAAFNRIYSARARAVTAPGANGEFGIPVSDVRAEAFVMGLGPTEPDFDAFDPKDRSAQRRSWQQNRLKAFDRAKKQLLAGGGYRVENEWIWEIGANKRGPK